MGRPKKTISFDMPEKGKIKVRSKTYGDHERAVRGSGKAVEVNSIMRENGRRMIGSNAPAKLIFDALKPFRENFKGGLFWQDLVKHFTKQLNKGEKYSVKGLENMDLNKNYPLSRMMSLQVEVKPEPASLFLMIKIKSVLADRFLKRCPYVNGMQLTFIGLFPDFERNDIDVTHVVLPVRTLKDEDTYSFIMDIPASATSYLLCCKAEGSQNGLVIDSNREVSKAMFIEMAQVW
jgi:hypothetical protein